MGYLYSFFGLLFLQFLLSKKLISSLSQFFFIVTKSHKLTVYLFSFLFLPGTLIHELSHYAMSLLLLVPAGKMTLIPKIDGVNVRLGSVQIGKTDPIRRLLIGAAPFLFGTALIIISLFLFFRQPTPHLSSYIIIGYILFEISNTMFSSKKDMEGSLEVLIAIIIISAVMYGIGIRVPEQLITQVNWPPVVRTFQQGSYLLFFPIFLDLTVITIFSVANKLINKY